MANALTAVRLALVLPFAAPSRVLNCWRQRSWRSCSAWQSRATISTDRVARMNRDGIGQGHVVRPQHGLPLRHRRTGRRRHRRSGHADPAGLDTARLWTVRRRFLRVASPAAAACQFSRALERHPLFRAPRAHRRGAIALPGWLCVVPADGGRRARVPAGGFDRRVHHRSRDDAVRSERSVRL